MTGQGRICPMELFPMTGWIALYRDQHREQEGPYFFLTLWERDHPGMILVQKVHFWDLPCRQCMEIYIGLSWRELP